MNNLRNSVRLTGFLGSAPEVKTLAEDKKVAKLSIATKDTYNNTKGEKVEDTQWHNLIAWNANANYAESFLKKGSEITIEGKLTSRSYVNKSGIKCYVTEIVVNEILMVEKK